MAEVIGRRIVGARLLTEEEIKKEYWEMSMGRNETVTALVLDDGSIIYASQDFEGNGPGALFGMDSNGEGFAISI